MKRGDFAVICAAALLSLLPLLLLLPQRGGAVRVAVLQHGAVIYDGPLSGDARIVTPEGGNVIEIKNGEARMLLADCPDGLCLRAGAAGALHPLVCLPNQVAVIISGEGGDALDAITQ